MTRVNITDGDKLKTGDTEPDLQAQLVKNNGVPKDLTSSEVTFQMREVGDDELVVDDDTTGNITIDEADLGRVSYSWQSGDTATAATYECEFTVEDGSGDVVTFPNQGFFTIQIQEGL